MPKNLGGNTPQPNPTPTAIANPSGTGAVLTSPRPQARPQQGAETTSFLDRLKASLPQQGSQAQHDMVMQLVQAGMQSAQQSGSPLLNFLAPIAGTVIGGRATSDRENAQQEEMSNISASVLGDHANNPEVQSIISVLNNENTPAYLKSIAQTKLDRILNPQPVASSGGTRTSSRRTSSRTPSSSPSTTTGQRNTRLYGNYEINGVMHGRDSFGNMVPYLGPDGQPVRSPSSESTGDTPSASPAPSIVEELTNLTAPSPVSAPSAPVQPTQPALDASDPLGILGTPPA